MYYGEFDDNEEVEEDVPPVRRPSYRNEYDDIRRPEQSGYGRKPRRNPSGSGQHRSHPSSRPGSGRRPPQKRPPSSGRPAGYGTVPRKKKKKKSGGNVFSRIYKVIVVLAALLLLAYGIYKIAFPAPDIPDPDSTSTMDAGDTGTAPGISNTGKYTRREQTYTFLLACPDQESGNADSIMVVTYDVKNKKVGMVSIPRDTLVNKKNPKINASFHGGVDNLKDVVSDLLGIPIDFTVTLDLNAFVELVDAVGGIDFDVPVEMYYNDPTQDLNIFYQPGYQHLSGQQAMEVCRFRKNADGTGYPMGDVQRSETTRNVILTVAKKLFSGGNIINIKAYVDIVNRNVDTDLSLNNMVYFAIQAMSLDLGVSVSGETLPGDGNASYRGTNYCYQLYPEECLDIVNRLINPYTQDITLSDMNIFRVK